MRKLIITVLCSLIVFNLLSCQKDTKPLETKPTNPKPVETKPVNEEVNEIKPIDVSPRKSFKLLSIGNSFSDDVQTYMYPILKAFGVQEITIANLYIASGDIMMHVNSAATNSPNYVYRKNNAGIFHSSTGMRMSYAINDEKWDFVSFQEVSGKSGQIHERKLEINALEEFVVNQIDNEKLKSLWHMTWAYQKNATHTDFHNYNKDQLTMYNAITTATQEAIEGNEHFDLIIPTATAIQNARTSYIGDTLTTDGYHLEDLAKFIAGLTWIVKTTNWPINDLNYDLLPQKFMRYWNIIEESVKNAIDNPFKVTPSKYLTDPYLERPLNEITTNNNLSYSDVSSNCKLDMYLPQITDKSYPVIVHFHGGGINSGSKNDDAHIQIASTIAKNGIGFISANYRLYPQAKYPEFIEDAAMAVKYVKDYMQANGLTGKLYVSGQSAGAYIGMMLLFNENFLNAVGLKVTDIDGWLLESGQPTTHFNVLGADGLDTQLQRVDEKAPMYYVSGKTKFKNLLLISYTNDIACRLSQTKLLYDAIKNYNPYAPVTLKVFEGNHCINSTTAYRNHYAHTDILINYVKGCE